MEIVNNIAIVVFANRKDFCLTKICISSIRYYYPDVEIFIVKDKLNGNFNTRRLCKAFNIGILDLGRKYYGWGAAKIHFILNKDIPRKRYLCLDSDIIFVGRFLDKLASMQEEFIVNPDWHDDPHHKDVVDLYIDITKIKKYYPDFNYPGYFFNTGQFVATPGIINEVYFSKAFDPLNYPYYKDSDTFPLVDQGVINAVLPIFGKRENLKIGTLGFMAWSVSFFNDSDNQRFEKFEDGEIPLLVHYAGDIRTHHLEKMKGVNLLKKFQQMYLLKLSKTACLFDKLQDKICAIKFINLLLYKKNRIYIQVLKTLK
ncbi:hypothetical protein MEO93_27235 [Dolichospermum sp. ST_sed3]|nr:hypothetical protein [Dolichospermum sp. ST_sed3]